LAFSRGSIGGILMLLRLLAMASRAAAPAAALPRHCCTWPPGRDGG